jgi:DNA-binding winged helix-turn-helix (wHTH) protein
MAGTTPRQIYEFGPFRLDAANRLLYRDSQIVPLPPKGRRHAAGSFVENRGSVVDKEALLSRVWPDAFVNENNLAHNISVLRRALGNGDSPIETIPKRVIV